MNPESDAFPKDSSLIEPSVAGDTHYMSATIDAVPLVGTTDEEHLSELNENLTLREKIHELRKAASDDFNNSGIAKKVGLAATAAWLAYEWGPGNETLTPILGGAVINNVNGPLGIAATAAITGGFTFLQQVASGATVAATATQFPNLAESTFNKFFVDKDHPELNAKPWQHLPLTTRLLYGFTMGTTFVASREAAVTGQTEFKKTMPRVVGSAALTGTMVAAIAGSVEALDTYGHNLPLKIAGLKLDELFIDVVTNPVTWLGLLGVSAVSGRIKRNKIRKELAKNQ